VTDSARSLSPEEISANVKKAEAEAEAALAEAEKNRAEAAKLNAEARAASAAADSQECRAAVDKIGLEQAERMRQMEQAADSYYHEYYFGASVSGDSVKKCIDMLTFWHRTEPNCPIEIVFNSPGGSVIPGMELFDFIRFLSNSGHKITTVAMGYAASMGGILLQAGDHRIIGRESYLLIHEISAATGGKIGDMKDDVAFYDKICARVVDIFVSRSGGKLTKAKMKQSWQRRDWWIDSEEALRLGLVDEVR
jgi:ATP-dependent Clp endopeptidase proteolytic subunit ClpP